MVQGRAEGEQVLRDPAADERLARDGIVMVPALSPEVIKCLDEAYWQTAPSGEEGIVLDFLRPDRALVRRLGDLLTPVWEQVVPAMFEHHFPVYSSFVVKHPGEGSSLFLHRDLNVDDERKHATYAMWVPLVDTGPELDNGALAFVPGSQHLDYGSFGPNAVGTFAPYERHLCTLLEPMTVPAGSALVYDARLLHASEPNRSAQPRIAIGCLLAHREHPVVQVVATGRRHRVVYEVDRHHFVNHAPAAIAAGGMPASSRVLDEYDEDPPVTDAAVLGPLLGPNDVERDVVVPGDLATVAGARAALPVTRVRQPHHRHDLAITASDLPPVGATLAGDVVVEATGTVGALDLRHRRLRVNRLPDTVPDAIVPLDPWRTIDATLLVVEPAARIVLTAPDQPVRRREVVVVECPAVRAGAATEDHVAELDLGVVVPVTPTAVHLWNEGPGPLVLVVRSRTGKV